MGAVGPNAHVGAGDDSLMVAPTVVLDLDGTLVDSAPDLVATLNIIFARTGLPPVAYDIARNMIGGGARAMIVRGLKAEGRTFDVIEIDRMVSDFIDHYAAHIAEQSRPFPGVGSALDTLAAHGCRLAVCTNKLEWLAVRLLDELALSNGSPPSAAEIRSGCKNRTRKSCGARSRAPAG